MFYFETLSGERFGAGDICQEVPLCPVRKFRKRSDILYQDKIMWALCLLTIYVKQLLQVMVLDVV